MAKQVNLYEAKTRLSELVEEAASGAEIVIAKNGKPKARLVPVQAAATGKRVGGQWAKYVKNDKRTPEEWWRDWKAADKEIEQMFEESSNEDWDAKWSDTSSTPTRSSGSRPARPGSLRKPSPPSKRAKTKSS
jgi:prevent-host-death family protein